MILGEDGATTLIAAAFKDMPEVTAKLLTLMDRKAINAVMKDGSTALILAANQVHSEVFLFAL